ncbi:MAG: hypothetical protein Q4C54_06105 [Clostridia bacterium]|nr:hypothetical protein [Clostridia bacterium]
MLRMMHGDDWARVLDADTEAVVRHAQTVGAFCHREIGELQVPLLLTGSQEDEMFPAGHYAQLFRDICGETKLAEAHIFAHGGHPAMMSNMDAWLDVFDAFVARNP